MPVALNSDYVPSVLEDSDIRPVIRLLGEVAVSDGDLAQKKQRLLSGMCRLIGGDGWSWSLTGLLGTEKDAVCLHSLSGGEAAALLTLPARSEKSSTSPAVQRGELATANRGLTISARQLSGDKMSALRFGRLPARAPFTRREELMARIFCEEVAWLHDAPRHRVPVKLKLTPRQMATLTLLNAGLSRKEIAVRLGLSPNTVHGYVKEIYRYFGTHSHAELLKRFPLAEKKIWKTIFD